MKRLFILLFVWTCFALSCTSASDKDAKLLLCGDCYAWFWQGVTPCSSEQRSIRAMSGSQTIRLSLQRTQQNRSHMSYLHESMFRSHNSFVLPSAQIRVLDWETGKPIKEAKVKLSVNPDFPVRLFAHPYAEYLDRFGERSSAFLVDHSDLSKAEGGDERFKALYRWALGLEERRVVSHSFETFLFGMMMRGGMFYRPLTFEGRSLTGHPGDLHVFLKGLRELQGYPSEGSLMLFQSIGETAKKTRRFLNLYGAPWLGSVTSISVSVDQSGDEAQVQRTLAQAKRDIRGSASDEEDEFSAVPLQAIVFPKLIDVSDVIWEKHLDQLCQLSQASVVSEKDELSFSGQVLPLWPKVIQPFEQGLEARLAQARHLATRYLELQLRYELSGLPKGKRYLLSFVMESQREESYEGRTGQVRPSVMRVAIDLR